MAANFPNLGKKTDTYVQEAQEFHMRWTHRDPHQDTVTLKCQVKDKERVLKADPSAEAVQPEGSSTCIQSANQHRPARLSFRTEEGREFSRRTEVHPH